MADLVDGAFFGLLKRSGGAEGVFFEKEADFVSRGEEVVVADVGSAILTGGELGHWVVLKVEAG